MRARVAGLLVLALIGVGGCGLVDGKERVGTLLVSWSQADDRDISEIAPDRTVVLADAAARDAFLAEVADGRGHDEQPIAAVDMDRYFLVLGSYSKCMDESRVWMDSAATAVWLESYVPREHRNTNCSWSPLTIDIWRVPQSELGETPADQLATSEPA